jgi:hypothetical protein
MVQSEKGYRGPECNHPEGTVIGYDRATDEKRGFKIVDMPDGKHLTVLTKGYRF